ncbi:hypothetical protein [Jatrophihabitans sp.]|uniref:hypothetical protein n=1 Tax=Jatrophihabitans sp. TaxID=1932789 RepID=UPI002D06FDC3|nr:hypothetical protein [Jatrophihabitans sp.]
MDRNTWIRAAADLRHAYQQAGGSPLVPEVTLTVNVRGGKPPGKLGELLGKHEHAVLDYLEKYPAERTRLMTDPLGVLREIVPDEKALYTELAAMRATKNATVADVPDVKLTSLTINVDRKESAS